MSAPLVVVEQDCDGGTFVETTARGIELLRLPLLNKGTAFNEEERIELELEGLLPPRVRSLEEQIERAYGAFRRLNTPIAQYQFLRALQERQEILFYAMCAAHLEEMLPIIYTPTVGDAVRDFSNMYETPRGLSLSTRNIDRGESCVDNYPFDDVRMIVATDSSAILGIGDQGYGGLAISIGKLNLYVVGGGVSPFQSMPVLLDVGTDRQSLLEDPMYLGVGHRRLRGDDYFSFVDRFVSATIERWPRAIIQWEDLSKEAAFDVLHRYRDRLPSFNDDIQGTGAVALAGLLGACRSCKQAFEQQRFVVHGAGAGGIGVAMAIEQELVARGEPREAARRRIFVLDSKGLLVDDRPLEGYKRPYAQPRAALDGWPSRGRSPNLEETVSASKATVLIGLSGQPHAFDEAVITACARNTERPIVFALSNPTSLSEAHPADVMRWTAGRAVVATGSPFAPVRHQGRTIPVGQGNNAFIFPGLGLGSMVSQATKITDGMVRAAAHALADVVRADGSDVVYPAVSELRRVSRVVATRVAAQAATEGVARGPAADGQDIADMVDAASWHPRYARLRSITTAASRRPLSIARRAL